MGSVSSYLLDNEDTLAREKIRLVHQARVFSKVEFPVLAGLGISFARVLDLGCGNGAYLSLLREEFRVDEAAGFERNTDLITQAASLDPSLRMIHGDLLDAVALRSAIAEIRPTLILLRFVLQHLGIRERRLVLESIRSEMPEGCILLLIEAEDSKIHCEPGHPALWASVKRVGDLQESRGGDRNIGASLCRELQQSGFQVDSDELTAFTTRTFDSVDWVEVLTRMWYSHANPEEKEAIQREVDDLDRWLREKIVQRSVDFRFPLRICTASVSR
jgi:hypothetical protein